MSEQKKLYRSQSDRVLGGVAAGLAKYLAVDPALMRVAFVALALVDGIGILIYFVMWLIIPAENSTARSTEETVGANAADIANQFRSLGGSIGRPGGALVVGIFLVVIGSFFLARIFVPQINFSMVWPLVLIAIGAFLIIRRR